jgi:hypothetical protein
MNVSVSPSLSSRSECLRIDIEIVSICFSFGDHLLCGGLLVGLASICSWPTPSPLAGGEYTVLLDLNKHLLK